MVSLVPVPIVVFGTRSPATSAVDDTVNGGAVPVVAEPVPWPLLVK